MVDVLARVRFSGVLVLTTCKDAAESAAAVSASLDAPLRSTSSLEPQCSEGCPPKALEKLPDEALRKRKPDGMHTVRPAPTPPKAHAASLEGEAASATLRDEPEVGRVANETPAVRRTKSGPSAPCARALCGAAAGGALEAGAGALEAGGMSRYSPANMTPMQAENARSCQRESPANS